MQKLKCNYYRFVPGDEKFPEDIYDNVAQSVTNQDIIVEVGCFMGRTTALMTELLEYYNKNPKFFAIDMFGALLPDGDVEPISGNMPWGEPVERWASRTGGSQFLIDHFDFYMANNPFAYKITDRVQFPPWHSSEEFDDESVFFVLLNASNTPDLVYKQLEKWWPKIRAGGSIAVARTDNPAIFSTVDGFNVKNPAKAYFIGPNTIQITK